jgi:hypothetical protein
MVKKMKSMQILCGQRWVWNKRSLVEIMENSKEFDPNNETILIKAKCTNYYTNNSWYFGKNYHNNWQYLEGQDKPQT